MESVSGRTVTRSIDCSERLHQAHFDILIDRPLVLAAISISEPAVNSTAIVTELSLKLD